MKVNVLKTNGLANKDIYIVFLEVGNKEDLADLPKPLNAVEKELFELCKEKFAESVKVEEEKTKVSTPVVTVTTENKEETDNEVGK